MTRQDEEYEKIAQAIEGWTIEKFIPWVKDECFGLDLIKNSEKKSVWIMSNDLGMELEREVKKNLNDEYDNAFLMFKDIVDYKYNSSGELNFVYFEKPFDLKLGFVCLETEKIFITTIDALKKYIDNHHNGSIEYRCARLLYPHNKINQKNLAKFLSNYDWDDDKDYAKWLEEVFWEKFY